jgi:hypothetical protein
MAYIRRTNIRYPDEIIKKFLSTNLINLINLMNLMNPFKALIPARDKTG